MITQMINATLASISRPERSAERFLGMVTPCSERDGHRKPSSPEQFLLRPVAIGKANSLTACARIGAFVESVRQYAAMITPALPTNHPHTHAPAAAPSAGPRSSH